MRISGRRDYMASLESVAMTDIILNMFIFFFISFSLLYTFNPYRVQKLEVKLPQATNVTPIKDTAQVDIIVTNEGLIYLNKELVIRRELKEKVKIIYKNNPKISIMLRADRLARFKDIVYVLDTLTELGVKNLNIVAIAEQ